MIDSRDDLHDAQPSLSDVGASSDLETGHDALAGRGSTRRASQSGGEPGRGTAAEGSLTFPDLPRLELDQLLGQLVERAQEVLVTQGRLRGLLRATQVVTGDLALPVVLQRIVAAARDLVGARYAALGVIAPDGGLSEFVHVGMPDDAVEAIGHLPHGKGLLGALIDDPHPIRLRRIGEDPRSSGFPAGHPPMTSFLGVPIRIRDEVFGNLYLADSTRGEFTAEDEQLTLALAATAAAAIDRARLYQAAHARGEWLQATAAITQRLLSTDLPGRAGTTARCSSSPNAPGRSRRRTWSPWYSLQERTCGWRSRSGRPRPGCAGARCRWPGHWPGGCSPPGSRCG